MRKTISLLTLAAAGLLAQQRQVAITIDDLPRGGDDRCEPAGTAEVTASLLAPLQAGGIPVIGFVNEGRCQWQDSDLRRILTLWLDAGAELGNHTYSHRDLNEISVAEFAGEIVRGERVTRPLLQQRGADLKYFRHPFLHVGLTLEKRRQADRRIAELGYTVAPVTIDDDDYLYASAYAGALRRGDRVLAERIYAGYVPYMESVVAFFEKRSVEVVGREFPQILLIHVSALNARAMPDLLTMFRKRGYVFVPLGRALSDAAYSLPDGFSGKPGISWIHHWAQTKGMRQVWEPDAPAWIREEAARSRQP